MKDDDTPRAPNLWNKVDDFNWLKEDQSPHWRILMPSDECAVPDETWEFITRGNPLQEKAENVLKQANINLNVAYD